MGVVYQLILHYQVGGLSLEGLKSSENSGKQMFISYLSNQASRFNISPIKNLTTSLRDGKKGERIRENRGIERERREKIDRYINYYL